MSDPFHWVIPTSVGSMYPVFAGYAYHIIMKRHMWGRFYQSQSLGSAGFLGS